MTLHSMLVGLYLSVLLCHCVHPGFSARLLLIPVQYESLVLMQVSVGEELVRRGHDVHIAMALRYSKSESILRTGIRIVYYHLPDDVDYTASPFMQRLIADFVFNPPDDPMKTYSTRWRPLYDAQCRHMMSDRRFLDELVQLHFDLVVVQSFPLSPCNLILPHFLRVPYVTFSIGIWPGPWALRLPVLPSFFEQATPARCGALGLPDIGKLFDRVINTAVLLSTSYLVMPWMWRDTSLVEQFAANPTSSVTSWFDLLLDLELILIDIDHHLGPPLPLMPNVVSVAGVTARSASPLPEPLEKLFADSCNVGVILVSFGSTAYFFPDDIVELLLQGLSRLEQTVVARLAVPDGVVIPENVKIMSWLPQNDILGHNKTRLFITHCGNNGQYEALYHGVPMLGFPLFAEQSLNCDRIRNDGLGLKMDIRNFTSAELFDTVRELLGNGSYNERTKRTSKIFRDQPMIGREMAAFWIEHVFKYGGRHLRSPASNMPLYQFLMLDILAFVATFVFCFVVISAFLLRVICRKFK